MRKIVHITDLHIGAPNCRAVIQDVVTNIINHLDPAGHAVVLTYPSPVRIIDPAAAQGVYEVL